MPSKNKVEVLFSQRPKQRIRQEKAHQEKRKSTTHKIKSKRCRFCPTILVIATMKS
jgi:hypothetical protein